MDEPARLSRAWKASRIRDAPSSQPQKGNTKGASREQVHTTQLVGVAGKWKPGGGKGHPLWRASRAQPSVEKHLGFCVLAQQKQTHSSRVPQPVTGEKSEHRKASTASLTSVCL